MYTGCITAIDLLFFVREKNHFFLFLKKKYPLKLLFVHEKHSFQARISSPEVGVHGTLDFLDRSPLLYRSPAVQPIAFVAGVRALREEGGQPGLPKEVWVRPSPPGRIFDLIFISYQHNYKTQMFA